MTFQGIRSRLDMSSLVRPVRSWAIGPGARWACPVIGGLLLLGGLIGFLVAGGR